MPHLLIGVDAGGTKTRAVLAERHSKGPDCLLRFANAGPGNPLSVGFDAATRALQDACQQVLGGDPCADVAVLAVAGCADPGVRDRVASWANAAGFARRVQVVPDYAPLLAPSAPAATPPPVEAGIIAGTGSVAYVQTPDGKVFRAGGWGYLLGDEGSGFAIGQQALQHSLALFERGEPADPLTELVLRGLSAATPYEALAVLYRSDRPRQLLATLAPGILALAQTEQAACAILEDQIEALAAVADRALKTAGVGRTPINVTLSGGIATANSLVRRLLFRMLRGQNWQITDSKLLREPAVESLAFAHI